MERISTSHTMILSVQADGVAKGIDAASTELGSLARQFDQAQRAGVKWSKVTAGAAANTNRAVRNTGRLGQQVGTQFGDFLVQVGNGGNVITAFAQQANQLGAFMAGPWGIAFTVATGVLAAFSAELFKGNQEFEEYEENVKSTAEALAELTKENKLLRLGVGPQEYAAMEALAYAQERLLRAEKEAGARGIFRGVDRTEQMREQVRLRKEELTNLRALIEEQVRLRQQDEKRKEELEFRMGTTERLVELGDSLWSRLDEIWRKEQDITTELSKRLGIAREYAALMRAAAEAEAAMGLDPFGGHGDWRYDLPQNIRAPSDNSGGGGGRSPLEQATEDATALESALKGLTLTWEQLAIDGVGGFVDALFDADQSFSEFAQNFLQTIAKMIVQYHLLNALARWNVIPGGNLIGNANGNVFSGGNVVPFASGGVVNSPTLFPMSNGTGLMGEAGPEAIVPLKRASNGDLGVGASPVNVTINNNAGAAIDIAHTEDGIEIAVNRARQAVAGDFARQMMTGQGSYFRSLEAGTHVRRRAT